MTSQQAYRSASKYNTLEAAQSGFLNKWETQGKMPPRIMLGENGHYIIPTTNRAARILREAGFERA